MKKTIYLTGQIVENSAFNFETRLKALGDFDTLEVIINSPGGSVYEGELIYAELRELSEAGKHIITKTADAASMATQIFCAGDERLIAEGGQIMIHMPTGNYTLELSGELEDWDSELERVKSLRDHFAAIREYMINFYSQFTNTSSKKIQRYLSNTTFMTAQEAVDFGIATAIYQETEVKALYQALDVVAFYDKEEKNNKETKNNLSMTWKEVKAWLVNTADAELAKEVEITNLLMKSTENEDYEFPGLEQGQSPSEGDEALKDGKPAEGEISFDGGITIKFEGGKVKEVIEAPEEETVTEEVEEPAQAVEEEETPVEAPVEEPATEEAPVEEDKDAKIKELEEKLAQLEEALVSANALKEEKEVEIVSLKKELTSDEGVKPTITLSNNTGKRTLADRLKL